VSDDDPFARHLNGTPKYVASRTLQEVGWQHSTLLKGDVAEEVAKLKEQPGKNIAVLGSGDLVQTLIEHNLVDEYFLGCSRSCWAAASGCFARPTRRGR
jgi:dihydrofolate reductase